MDPCDKGYEGNLCTSCTIGYGRVGDAECTKCPEEKEISRLMLAGMLLALLTVISYLVYANIKDATKTAEEAVVSSMSKVFLDYLQIVSMAKGFQIRWPSAVAQLFKYESVVSNPMDQVFSLDCMLDLNVPAPTIRPFYTKMLGFVLLPFLSFLLPLAIVPVYLFSRRYKAWRKKTPLTSEMMTAEKKRAWQYYTTTSIVVLFMVHPMVSQKMFKLFSCVDLGGGRMFLKDDLAIECSTPEFRKWMLFLGVPSTVLYGAGVPLGVALLLYRCRFKLDDPDVRRKWSFLYRGYEHRCWYWELIIICRKLILALIVSSLADRPSIQGLLGLGVLIATMTLNLKLLPWQSDLLDQLDLMASIISTSTVYAGLYFYSTTELSPDDSAVITWVLITVNVCFIAYFFFVTIRFNVTKMVHKHRNRFHILRRLSEVPWLRGTFARVAPAPKIDVPEEAETPDMPRLCFTSERVEEKEGRQLQPLLLQHTPDVQMKQLPLDKFVCATCGIEVTHKTTAVESQPSCDGCDVHEKKMQSPVLCLSCQLNNHANSGKIGAKSLMIDCSRSGSPIEHAASEANHSIQPQQTEAASENLPGEVSEGQRRGSQGFKAYVEPSPRLPASVIKGSFKDTSSPTYSETVPEDGSSQNYMQQM